MPLGESSNFEVLVDLIRGVKPSLSDTPIRPEDSLVDHLALDSLDIMQLARKVRRTFGAVFEPQSWTANHAVHGYSVQSLLDATGDTLPSEQKTDARPANAPV